MTEQDIAAIVENLIQRISKLEAKAQVNMMLIQILIQDTDLAKTIPGMERAMKGYLVLIKDMPNYEDVHKEFQDRLNGLKDNLQNKQNLKNS